MREYEKLQKKEIQLQAQLATAESNQAKRVQILNEKKKEQAKIQRQQAKEAAGLVGAYEKESRKLIELRKRFKDLAVSEKATSAETRNLQKEITALDSKLKKVDAAAGQFQRNVGNYGASVKAGLRQTTRFAMSLAGGAGLVGIIRSGFTAVKDFDQSIGNLAAVSGKTRAEIQPLTDEARRLGASTQYTAGQVAGLETELAKLGFDSGEILNSTEAILDFATATGAELAPSAALAGSALRAFGLDSSEMSRVVSTLGVATSKSALDFEKLNAGLSTVAPVANAFGFSIEDTTALLGQLSNAGFDASSAATATRNILLNLADANGDLAKQLGRPIKSADDLAAGLQELQEKGIDLASALELTDKRSVAAFQTFLQGSDSLVELRDSITDADGELKTMAETQRDTLGGAIDRLRSAWEGFILDLSEGAGAFVSLKDIINFVADNLTTIIKVVTTAGTAWLSFKVALGAQRFYKGIAGGLADMSRSTMFLSRAFKKGAFSARALGAAVKSIPFVGIVSGITTIITAIGLFGDSTEDAFKNQELLNKAFENGKKAAEDYVGGINSVIARLKEQAKQEIALAKAQGESEKDLAKRATKSAEDIKKSQEDAIESISQKREDLQEKSLELIELEDKLNRTRIKNEKEALKRGDVYGSVIKSEKQKNKEAKIEFEILQKRAEIQKELGIEGLKILSTSELQEEIDGRELVYSEEQKKAKAELKNIIIDILNAKKDEEDLDEEALKNARKKAEEYRRYLEGLRKRLQDLEDESIRDNEAREIQQLRRKFDREIAGIKGNTALENELRQTLEATFQREANKIKKKYHDEWLASFKKAEINAIEEVDKAREEKEKKRLAILDKNLNQELGVIDNSYKKKELALLESGKTQEEIDKELFEQKKKQLEEEIETLKAFEQDSTDKEIELARMKAEEKARIDEKAQQDKINRAKETEAILQALSDKADERADKRIQEIDKQVKASEDAQARLIALADAGNLEADKSITAEIKRQEALEKEKQKLERRKQLREIGLAAFKGYTAKVEAGSKTPVIDTLKDLTTLTLAIRSLPAFFEGTENTGNGGNVDNKGGFLSILHPKERVMTAEQNSKMHGYSNDAVADIINQYHNNKAVTLEGVGLGKILAMPKKEDVLSGELKRMNNTLNNSVNYMKVIAEKPSYLGTNWNNLTKSFEEVFKTNHGVEKRIQNLNNGL
jgi:TP901 family phage tail tape measure protein